MTASIPAILGIKGFSWATPEPEFIGIRLANILDADELALAMPVFNESDSIQSQLKFFQSKFIYTGGSGTDLSYLMFSFGSSQSD
jgi:hypothetical protein